MGHFTCWISLTLRPKTETKRLNFACYPEFSLSNHRGASSLTSSATHRWFRRISSFIFELVKSGVIFARRISNWLTYLVHAKSTDELISFGFSDRSVRSLEWLSQTLSESLRQNEKNDFIFWLIFGLSPNLGLSDSLSERLVQKVKFLLVLPCTDTSFQIKSNKGFVVRSILRNRGLLRITTIKYKKINQEYR